MASLMGIMQPMQHVHKEAFAFEAQQTKGQGNTFNPVCVLGYDDLFFSKFKRT